MSDIGPGDWVECLRDFRGAGPKAGRVYQVLRVYPGPFNDGAPFGIDLADCRPAAVAHGYAGQYFRPRKRPWSEWLTSEPADRREPVS